MASPESRQIRATFGNDRETVDVPLAVERQAWQAAAEQTALPPGITIAPVDAGGVPGEWVGNPEAELQQALLLLHGGGYNAGSCVTHRELAARLCVASGARVLLIDYRSAPEDPFPAAVEDAAAAYQWLLEYGLSPEQIIIGGDSAGGGLALATMVWARDHGVALPVAGVLLSPWVDLALAGPTMETRAAVDPMVSAASLRRAAKWYLGDGDPKQPLASPLYAEMHGLPPLLLLVGDDEVLLSDSTRLAERARDAGVDVTLDVWEGMWHVFPAFAGTLPEGRQAIERIGAFIRQKLAPAQPALPEGVG